MATNPFTNESVFLWEEDAMVAAAKQIKQKNPATSVIAWFDTLMVYTGWNVDPKNTTVNTTFNKGATVSCATGHFRPAEFIEQEGRSMLLRNGSNQLVHNAYGGCHVYDHSQAATRQFWQNMCLNMTKSGVIDGCGADFSAMGENRWSAHTPTNIAKELGIPLAKATAWAAGHTQMMRDTQAALGNGLLMGKDAPELGDHVHGVLEEGGCYKRNSTVNTLRNLTARARAAGAAGKAWVYQCHSSDATTDTLAAFLAGAGDGHFLTVGGWYNGAVGHWVDDFAKPLGAPLGDAIYNGTTWLRSFESGTQVTFTPHINKNGQDMAGTGTVVWG